MTEAVWDLTALLNAADPKAARPERHLWLVRLVEWLRHGEDEREPGETPRPVLRLKHLLNVLERNAKPRERIVALLARFWRETELATLFADFGFTARRDLWGELGERLNQRFLPATPDTDDLGTLFQLLFTDDADATWLRAIDDDTLTRLAALFARARADAPSTKLRADAPTEGSDWRGPLLQAMTWLVSVICAAAIAPPLRRRMSAELLVDRPFEQLVRAGEALADSVRSAPPGIAQPEAARQHATYLLALLDRCRRAADSVTAHLEEHGVSVHIVFELEQLNARISRVEAVLGVLLSESPQRELQTLLADLVALSRERRSLRALLARQYSLLARKVAERHAETGEHYITRTREEYRDMLRAAGGGGVVIAGTTFAKFALLALGLAPFWGGFAAGLNYAISFLVIHLMHWTVATKQPAMTAPAMAEKLANLNDDAAVDSFVDEVAHLVRSQIAGIAGNLALVVPVVLAVQGLAWAVFGRPLVGEHDALYALKSITLLGPTLFFAAFTGILLFASSLIAGWVENWFVYHRLDSALAHNPAIVARLGATRALRWSAWWRRNISGLAANTSLGLLLGLVPTLLAFVGVPLDVRHVTLSTGQLAAAASTLGWATLALPAFWWCLASLPLIGVLNLGVSFWLALRVALRSRGITLGDRRRLSTAIRARLWHRPRSFLLPD
ncbi:site-specific recombinase [Aquabacterium sp.]|uniref:site-specific recombinase n=1 Tax=Aquabacterium sp. TaxID=1872578 RepID=UPI002CF09D58|nr:site-specific recombinase [Aquabacterium sp.]HSW07748.1 site-specific recombinase [Aquabacterium sp.]